MTEDINSLNFYSKERIFAEYILLKDDFLNRKSQNLGWSNHLEARAMRLVFEIFLVIHKNKSKHYGNAWKKRGWRGIFDNLCRKWDRIDNVFQNTELYKEHIESNDVKRDTETILDTMGDLGNYCFLAVTELLFTKEAMFEAWLESSLGLTKEDKLRLRDVDKKDIKINLD